MEVTTPTLMNAVSGSAAEVPRRVLAVMLVIIPVFT
jgi:hypothetical protein